MKKLVWGLGLFGLAIWTLLTWGTYALMTGAGDFFAANAEWLALAPDWQYWLQWSLRLVEQFGVVLLWIVWGFGVLCLLIGTWLVAKLAGAAGRFGAAAPGTLR